MSIDLNQFNAVFFEESQEHLEEMEQLLMELSVEEPDIEQLNSVFRAAHSIKGGSGIFGFSALTDVTHVMENLLDKARKLEYQLTVADVDLLLNTVDDLGVILQTYRDDDEPDWEQVESAKQALQTVLGEQFDKAKQDDSFGLFEPVAAQPMVSEADFGFFDDAPGQPSADGAVEDADFGFFEPLAAQSANIKDPQNEMGPVQDEDFGLFESESSPKPTQSLEPVKGEDFDFFDTPAAMNHAQTPSTATTASDRKATIPVARRRKESSKAKTADSSTIRVDIQKVDNLVNLVGELVITQSMLNLIGKDVPDSMVERTQSALAELERNTREIQEAVMSVRMLPMSFVFSRFPRLVRDLSSKMGKAVDLHIEGETTEIDKGLIEKVVDPLTHLVRNSLDHGIESEASRIEAGKPSTGNLTLRAQQTGSNIVLSIIDDGAGLNRDKILSKANESGLSIPDNPSDDQVWQLIFEAGFSTADTVTDVSGRGVGMDVVRRNIESLNGRVEVISKAGEGSQFDIHLPLTLAILDGMCVGVGNQTFVVPLTNIVESLQPQQQQLKVLKGDQLLWNRDMYWPLVDVRQALTDRAASHCAPIEASIVVLVETANKRFGLIVDDLQGQQQVVIKSLERHYRRVTGIAGATIMGDGSVALILDVDSLAQNVNRMEPTTEMSL